MIADDSADADTPTHRIEVAGRTDLIMTGARGHISDSDSEHRDDLIVDALAKRPYTNHDAARQGALDSDFHLVMPFWAERRVRDVREGPLGREPGAD